MSSVREFLVAWRIVALRDREVVDAIVHPNHSAPSPELARALETWPGPHYWSDEDGGRRLVLIRPTAPARAERWGFHTILLLATLGTTLFSGAVFSGALPWFQPGRSFPADWWHALPAGWTYALPLVAILFAHEMGHYVTARRYAIDASPPYFLPWPFWPFLIGTLGAFIRLRSPVVDRRQLLDVGAAGPLAGFVVAVPVLVIGLLLSEPVRPSADHSALVLVMGGQTSLSLGHSAITWALMQLTHADAAALQVHPMAFAGWLGVFVTMLNLIPLAQLDGGHILYALFGRWQPRMALAFWVLLLFMGFFWHGWAVWAALVLLLSRGRLAHPPVVDGVRPLPPSRRWLAWASVALFLLTFTPVPLMW